MSQAAQSTAVQHANARERLSDSDEGAVREYRVQNTDQALSLALKQGVGSPTTRVHDQDMERGTLSVFASREQDGNVLSRVLDFSAASSTPDAACDFPRSTRVGRICH